MKRKFIISLSLILILSLALTACGGKRGKDNDFGDINPPNETEDYADFLAGDDYVVDNFYQSNNFKSLHVGDNIDVSEVKESDLIIGKMYFISDKEKGKFIDKEIQYVKGDIEGLITSYHRLVSKNTADNAKISIKVEDNSLFIDFESFSPMMYVVENQLFRENYLKSGGSDVAISPKAEELVLEGYYRTAKANFSDIEYVYFQIKGNPWEVIRGEVHDGLLFLEPGQTRPSRAPESLFNMVGEHIDQDTGWSINYSGDRQVDQATDSFAGSNEFSGESTEIDANTNVNLDDLDFDLEPGEDPWEGRSEELLDKLDKVIDENIDPEKDLDDLFKVIENDTDDEESEEGSD